MRRDGPDWRAWWRAGAGRRAGTPPPPPTHSIFHSLLLAVAHGPRVALLPLPRPPGTPRGPGPARLALADGAGPTEAVTALRWAAFADAPGGRLEAGCLLLGTSSGHLGIMSEKGRLLHRQRLHARPVASIRLRPAGAGLDPLSLCDDATLVFPDAVVRLAAAEVRSVVRAAGSPGWRDSLAALPPLGFQKWDVSRGCGPRCDGVVVGPRPPGLREALDGRDAPRLVLLTAGTAPVLAAHDAEEHAPRRATALVADLASSVAAGLLGAARSAVVGREGGLRAGIKSWVVGRVVGGDTSPARPASAASSASAATSPSPGPSPPGPEKLEPPPPGETASLWRSLADGPRRAAVLLPAPAGALAVLGDCLGRFLLVDASSGLAVRIWKGYRGAQFGWLALHGGSGGGGDGGSAAAAGLAAATSPPTRGKKRKSPDRTPTAAAGWDPWVGPGGSDGLLLLVYAPRRAVVEAWDAAAGVRVASLRAPARGRLLCPDPVLGLGAVGGGHASGGGAWLLDTVTGDVMSVGDAVREQVGW